MALVQSVDYVGRRIYLSALTVNTSLDTLDVYREVRALRRTTESHRGFKPMILGGGNLAKIPGVSYTPAYVQLLYGCLIVPWNQTGRLKLVRDTFTTAGQVGADVFDRSGLSPGVVVDIDVAFAQVEIRQVNIAGTAAPTAAQIADAVWAKTLP